MNEIMGKEEIKQYILRNSVISAKGKRNRIYRMAIKELAEEGYIYIPIGDFIYKRIEECTEEQRNRYIREQTAAIKTQYFNLMHVKHYMNDEQLSELHNGGLQLKER